MTTMQEKSFAPSRIVIQTGGNTPKQGVFLMKKSLPRAVKKKKQYPSITFRPDEKMKAQIERAARVTKMKKSTIVQECVREYLPHLLALTWKQTHELVGDHPALSDVTAPNSLSGFAENKPLDGEGGQPSASRPSRERNK